MINNAGIAPHRGLDELTEADFDRTIAVNLKSAFLCTQAALAHMRANRWGRMCTKAACVHRKADLRFTAMVRSKSASVRSSRPRYGAMPALLINTSTPSSWRSMAAIIAATAAASDTSARIAIALRPSLWIASTTASALCA